MQIQVYDRCDLLKMNFSFTLDFRGDIGYKLLISKRELAANTSGIGIPMVCPQCGERQSGRGYNGLSRSSRCGALFC
jgi:hypothetical protein